MGYSTSPNPLLDGVQNVVITSEDPYEGATTTVGKIKLNQAEANFKNGRPTACNYLCIKALKKGFFNGPLGQIHTPAHLDQYWQQYPHEMALWFKMCKYLHAL